MGAAPSSFRLRARYPFLLLKAGAPGQPLPAASQTLNASGTRPAGLVRNAWKAEGIQTTRPVLAADHAADVIVVGGGVAGLSAALALLKSGVASVTVLEGRAVGCGNSARTTAHLMPWIDDGIGNLIKAHGPAVAAVAVAAQYDALAWIEATVRGEGIACQHERVPGYLFAQSPSNESMLEDELAAARAAGMGTELVDWADLGRETGSGSGGCGKALNFKATAQLSPGTGGGGKRKEKKEPGHSPWGLAQPRPFLSPFFSVFLVLSLVLYCQGLAAAVERHGGRIFENTRVKTYATSHAGGASTVTLRDTPGLTVIARSALVLATCSPCNKDLMVHARQSPWRSYVVGLTVPKAGAGERAGAASTTTAAPPPPVVRACYWTVDEAEYKYTRLAVDETPGAKHDVLVVGGEDHEVAQAPPLAEERGSGAGDAWSRLAGWARARWPVAGEIVYKWSGIVLEPADGLGLVGWSPIDAGGRVFVVTGDSGQGFTNAAIGAMIAAGEVGGAPTPAWAHIFNPRRPMVASAPRLALSGMAHEALATAKGLASRVRPSLTDIEALRPGCGGIGQSGLFGKVAVFVDGDGTRHEMCGTCPHMGCTLTYNGRERAFDCPCHGSSFDSHGVCIQGPATSDLAQVGGGGPAAAEE